MTSPGAAAPARRRPALIGPGRPPWWAVLLGVLVTVLVTVDLLRGGVLERLDLAVSDIISGWGLRDSAAYWPIWVLTQLGGRVTILVVLLALVAGIAWRRRSLVPLVRVVVALVLLTAVVYAVKHGTGRTAPAYPGSYFHREGASYPSGHVANAVLMWGVARWQAVDFGLPARVQRALWVLSVVGPVVTGVAMVTLDFHWVTDALVGASLGLVLLGVVHALDAVVLSRSVRARGRRTAA